MNAQPVPTLEERNRRLAYREAFEAGWNDGRAGLAPILKLLDPAHIQGLLRAERGLGMAMVIGVVKRYRDAEALFAEFGAENHYALTVLNDVLADVGRLPRDGE